VSPPPGVSVTEWCRPSPRRSRGRPKGPGQRRCWCRGRRAAGTERNSCSSVPRGMPGPSSMTAISTRLADLTRGDPHRAVRCVAQRVVDENWPARVRADRCRPSPRRRPPQTLTRSSPCRRNPVTPLLIPSRARCTVSSRYTSRSSGRSTHGGKPRRVEQVADERGEHID